MEVAPMIPSLDGVHVFNEPAALEQVDGDRQLLQELLNLYLRSSQRLVSELHQSVAAGDNVATGRLAHSLKGASGNVAADRVRLLSATLEQCMKNGKAVDGPAFVRIIQRETEAFRALAMSVSVDP
ncbi:MAG: Hpt domain-containing protein [Planctomycetota bacterium]